jgi:putative hydrolase of the HAD superfamily
LGSIFDKNITDVFFDLDHTLWDFDKNSEYTFRFIFDNEKINLSLKLFLPIYNSNNHYFWSLYRQDKISYEELRIIRLKKSFSDLKFKVSNKKIEKISEIYFKSLIESFIKKLNVIKFLKYISEIFSIFLFETLNFKSEKLFFNLIILNSSYEILSCLYKLQK